MGQVNRINRPWHEKKSQRRYNPDPYYQSSNWRSLRESFRNTYTVWSGQKVSNTLCMPCFRNGIVKPGRNTDHKVARKAGGRDEHANLETQCDSCHAKKSANEGKKFKAKKAPEKSV